MNTATRLPYSSSKWLKKKDRSMNSCTVDQIAYPEAERKFGNKAGLAGICQPSQCTISSKKAATAIPITPTRRASAALGILRPRRRVEVRPALRSMRVEARIVNAVRVAQRLRMVVVGAQRA